MSAREQDHDTIVKGLQAIEGGEVRAEDRRRFARRREDDATAPSLHQLEAAVSDLRQRVDTAQEIRQELIGARDVVAALRAELRTMQAELAAERVASRRARMQVAWLESELRRRQEAEAELRASLAAMSAPDDVNEAPRSTPPALRAGAVDDLREALAELSGQSDLARPEVPAVSELDFDAAAARLRDRAAKAEGRRGPVRLMPRGAREAAGPWLRDGLLELAAEDAERAERLMVALLAAQAGYATRPLSYGLVVQGGGSYRVSVMQQGAAVGALTDVRLDGTVSGPLQALIPLATGGGSKRLSGARVRGRSALRPLLSNRRRPVQLSELALLLRPLAPRDILEIAVLAIDPARVDRDAEIDVVCGNDALRISCRIGERPVVTEASSTTAGARIHTSRERLASVLAGQGEVAIAGDARAVAAWLRWLDAPVSLSAPLVID